MEWSRAVGDGAGRTWRLVDGPAEVANVVADVLHGGRPTYGEREHVVRACGGGGQCGALRRRRADVSPGAMIEFRPRGRTPHPSRLRATTLTDAHVILASVVRLDSDVEGLAGR